MKAFLKLTRISSKKSNLVAALVRNKKVTTAVDILKFTPKKAASLLKKLIESAAANAENNLKQKKENLYIKEIIVTEGPTYKRSIPVSRGRTHPILKRTSHITVKLAVLEKTEESEKIKSPAKEKLKKTDEEPAKKEEKPENSDQNK